jgi:hypothetical protein
MVVIFAPVVLESGHSTWSYASIAGMKEPEELGRGYLLTLSSFRSMDIMARKL